ncbi:hypothetical protein STENM327S_00050 [Streptomyces tendae]
MVAATTGMAHASTRPIISTSRITLPSRASSRPISPPTTMVRTTLTAVKMMERRVTRQKSSPVRTSL